ncbi:MAG: hypothetical protein KDC92_04855 [Bacteroidetes bacterium]|nr:hypothetical protein [Bacteroidota bacterium]
MKLKGLKIIVLVFAALVFVSCNKWSNKKIEEGITNYFELNNRMAGGGNTSVSSIQVIEKITQRDSCMAKAFVKGHFANSSLPVPIEKDFSDTLEFILITPDQPLVVKVGWPKESN